ncbi:fluoride efflux transporter CrcB [Ancylobacter terrae]|uniref:fluoride efflux transporter CrcB n=1 Tax=Ancylobacter sp. sgz301288 TaxID=3342077 RepID=UPI003859DEC5
MTAILLVFVGAGIGGVLRHLIGLQSIRLIGTGFPAGTLAINVLGSLLIGLLAGWFAFRGGAGWSAQARLFLMTGVLGGFTTFSSFSLDFALLIERNEIGLAALYAIASVGLSFLGVFAGLALMRSLA